VLQVRCPAVHVPQAGDGLRLFVAGGISGCGDWQSELIGKLRFTPYCVFNPRRERYPHGDRSALEFQIRWEHEHLAAADMVSFWFPPETLCPISLYELGKVVASASELFVAAHPAYARREDLEIQLGLVRRDVKVVDSLEALAGQLVARAG
jgi:hypothetical protein